MLDGKFQNSPPHVNLDDHDTGMPDTLSQKGLTLKTQSKTGGERVFGIVPAAIDLAVFQEQRGGVGHENGDSAAEGEQVIVFNTAVDGEVRTAGKGEAGSDLVVPHAATMCKAQTASRHEIDCCAMIDS